MEVDSVGIIAILSMPYHMHSKNIDRRGKNPQSAHKKSNYHTRCGKNWHKILYVRNAIFAVFAIRPPDNSTNQ